MRSARGGTATSASSTSGSCPRRSMSTTSSRRTSGSASLTRILAIAIRPTLGYQGRKAGAPRYESGRFLRGEDAALHLVELERPGAPAEHHHVAVLEEGGIPAELDQRAFRARARARDRAGGHQVARPEQGAVRGRVCELLRHRPVEGAGVPAGDHLA